MIGVCIVTYNQEQYIAQAIESVLSQGNCGHKVVAYIGNDCSIDHTGEICHRYAALYQGRIKVVDNVKNLGLVGNTMNLLNIMRKDGCEYIAMLDGDDYWCDDHKLMKQMTYMEAHPEYGLVHTYVDSLYPDGLHIEELKNVAEGDVFHLIGRYPIGNCSVLYKADLLDFVDFVEFQNQGLRSCDYVMYAIFASQTQFGFIPEHTAVWRRGIESVSGTFNMEKQIQYVQNDLAHWRYLSKLFPQRWPYTQEAADAYYHKSAFNIAFRFGDRKRALQEAKQMSSTDRRHYRCKIIVAHSAILSFIWRQFKEKMYK